MRIKDVGKGDREERRNARMKAWKRPKLKKDRQAESAERKADWEVQSGIFNSTDTSIG